MERYKIGFPTDDNMIIKSNYIINEIFPLSIRKVEGNTYTVLFTATQDCTEETIFIQMLLKSSGNLDKKFLDENSLNFDNIRKSPTRLQFYKESTENLNTDDIYSSDFNMGECKDKKVFFTCLAGRIAGDKCEVLNLFITRDNYIKLSLFFNKLMNYDNAAEIVFMNKKLKNIEFATINHVKLDASATDMTSNVVCNHYTCGVGPTIFKFNYISPKNNRLKLRNPLLPELYNTFYSRSFIVTDMIYDIIDDKLIVLWEERSDITNQYKSTKALVFTKEFYDKTNLLDLDRIYEKEEKNNE